jgi:hypothetical protein
MALGMIEAAEERGDLRPAPGTFLYRSLGPKSRTASSTWFYRSA